MSPQPHHVLGKDGTKHGFLERCQSSSPPRVPGNPSLGNCGCRFHPQAVLSVRIAERGGMWPNKSARLSQADWEVTSSDSSKTPFQAEKSLEWIWLIRLFFFFFCNCKTSQNLSSSDGTFQDLEQDWSRFKVIGQRSILVGVLQDCCSAGCTKRILFEVCSP